MTTDFLTHARSFAGTPFLHQGRLPGVGLDCAGVVACALQRCGEAIDDCRTYRTVPDPVVARDYLHRNGFVPVADPRDGDVALMHFGNGSCIHYAVLDGDGFIHVERGQIVKWQPMTPGWRSLVDTYYRRRS